MYNIFCFQKTPLYFHIFIYYNLEIYIYCVHTTKNTYNVDT